MNIRTIYNKVYTRMGKSTCSLHALPAPLSVLPNLLLALTLGIVVAACSYTPIVPTESKAVNKAVSIYPDYRDVVVPPNIAPLNIRVESPGTEFVCVLQSGGREVVAGASSRDEAICFDSLEWRSLLTAARGKDVTATIYALNDGEWEKYPSYKFSVAPEEIDRYLSYRLIEPSYELYRQLGLYRRDLSNFDVYTLYENNRTYDADNNHCVNCHNYQNYSSRRMLFHVRAKHGGTVFLTDGKPDKRQMKSDSILAGATYPTWHPTRNWVVFSSNQTGQAFHLNNREKIEVVDYGSDLIFYDADKQTITNVLKTDTDLETFPCWSADGRHLYYTSAHVPEFEGKTTDERRDIITRISSNLHYNVMSMDFDPQTRRFSAPKVEVDCAAANKSAAVARISPDGRYLLFTLADFGQFHIWHRSADLYVKDLQTDKVYPLTEANSPDADSYHTWSSNGRWIVFVSRRDDGSYSRPYISYFDHNGRAHKAFILPQRDPQQNILLPKSYNVPELTRDNVLPLGLKEEIYKD